LVLVIWTLTAHEDVHVGNTLGGRFSQERTKIMVSKLFRKWIALSLVGAIVPLASGLGQDESPPAAPAVAEPIEVVLQAQSPGTSQAPNVITLITDAVQEGAKVEQAPTSEYYLGIALGELPEVAKKQLKLEHGLVVDEVLPDSPAAKAEFKSQDILIRAGDTKLAEPADILKAVDEAKDKEMRIIVLRDGQEVTLKVTPAKRPKSEAGEIKVDDLASRLPQAATQRIEEALRELKGQAGAPGALELIFPQPGVVARRVAKFVELPKNMKISITREGDGPAKIHVEREGKTWDTTDDKLGELPEDVRGQVEQMLSKVVHPMLSARARALVVPKGAHVVPPAIAPLPGVPGVPAVPPAPGATPSVARVHSYRVVEGKADSLEAKVDQILKKLGEDNEQTIEKLRDEVERLRKEVESLKNK
jgi:hypothetical protein